MLSPVVQELIVKARIVSFADWSPSHTAEVIARFQAADDQKRYLTDQDLAALTNQSTVPAVVLLRDRAAEIVDQARVGVLQQFPDILEPGGGLYPEMRAEACWRDFWHFLRCVTYGIAGQQVAYTSQAGLLAMEQLYVELQVPLPAMVVGLEGLKTASLQRLDGGLGGSIEPYFDRLIAALKAFQ